MVFSWGVGGERPITTKICSMQLFHIIEQNKRNQKSIKKRVTQIK